MDLVAPEECPGSTVSTHGHITDVRIKIKHETDFAEFKSYNLAVLTARFGRKLVFKIIHK